MRKSIKELALGLSLAIASFIIPASPAGNAQQTAAFDRLPQDLFDITPPSARVSGIPGKMQITERSCRSTPTFEVRRRIVNAAIQEWAFFGFNIEDQTRIDYVTSNNSQYRSRFPRMDPVEAERLADSIGGYWAATPDSDWILRKQNDAWLQSGIESRWRDAWSAAFISWVMCESGLGDNRQFKRAIAHHTYIDQAILARDASSSEAMYTAFEPGTESIVPGDLLCRGSRPAYKTIAERREQLGVGARTHCDIVVKTDTDAQRIMLIGGNVRGSVRMKIISSVVTPDGHPQAVSDNGRLFFAHLKLRTEAIEANALNQSPTLLALGCNARQTSTLMLLGSC
jgi:hypothetical protein